jgi:hypothetical protein
MTIPPVFEASTPPVIFKASEPLVIRPIEPRGFALETLAGQRLFSFNVNFTECTFRLTPLGALDDTTYIIEASWIEIP